MPSSKQTWLSFEHDALLLSRRLSLLPHGNEELRKPGFLRYWCVYRGCTSCSSWSNIRALRFYLVAIGAVSTELELLESYLGEVRNL